MAHQESSSYPELPVPKIQQDVEGDRNQAIGQAWHSMIVNVSGGEVFINTHKQEQETIAKPAPSAHEEYGNPVKQGLSVLIALMQVPEVRRSVTTFRVAFEVACQQIDIIADYKALHDLLHNLEFRCYNGIVHELERLSKDPVGIDNLIDHDLTLQNLLAKTQEITTTEIISAYKAQLLSDLQEAQEKLHAAIEKLDLEYLHDCKWQLNRVLSIQPSCINTHLVSAAKFLPLTTLVNAMQVIAAKLADANLEQEKLQQFQQGVKSLRLLDLRLTGLVSEHDNWQQFDLELRWIEANLEQDILERSWPNLQERTKRLFNPSADQRAITFQQYSQNLDVALKGQDLLIVNRCFRIYCRQAKENFYQVDLGLKRLCEELREVGRALALVLEVIG